MNQIQILIVEDDPIIADDINVMLEYDNFNVCGIAYNKARALKLIDENNIDIVLLDINLNGKNEGFEIAKYLSETKKIPFIYLTSYAEKGILEIAKKTQPMAYIVKPFTEKDLFANLEISMYNFSKLHFSTGLNKEQIDSISKNPLSEREYEVLIYLNKGFNNSQIAEELFVSVNTIKTHLRNIYEKLNTRNRIETLVWLNKMLR